MKHKTILFTDILVLFVLIGGIVFTYFNYSKKSNQELIKPINQTKIDEVNVYESIVISAVGDCTIGTDPMYGYDRSFTSIYDKNVGDYGYLDTNKDISRKPRK